MRINDKPYYFFVCNLSELKILIIGLLFFFLGSTQKVSSQNVPVNERTRILFLLDASGSMHQTWGKDNEPRIVSAKRILNEIMDSLNGNPIVELALRVYGHQSPLNLKDCRDTKLEAGFSRNNISFIKSKLRAITPRGITPIAYSLQQCANDFPDNKTRNIVILMTDGEESCQGDPCAVAYELEQKNIVLKHFAIGIGISEEAAKTFQCFGSFYNVTNQESFKKLLNGIIKKVINNNTSQVLLLDAQNRPLETDAVMTFYDAFNHMSKYVMYHTMDAANHPDTLTLDLITDYNISIHTIPVTEINQVQLVPQQHNIITANTPQGIVEFRINGILPKQEINEKLRCLIRKGNETLFDLALNEQVKLISGTYTVEILSIPRVIFPEVKVSSNKNTRIQITAPGLLTLQKKYEIIGGIFLRNNLSLEKIFNLSSGAQNEWIALQPGEYQVIYRIKNSMNTHSTKTIFFEIKSGESQSINLQ